MAPATGHRGLQARPAGDICTVGRVADLQYCAEPGRDSRGRRSCTRRRLALALWPAGAGLLSPWDRRLFLIGANSGRLLRVRGVAGLRAAGTSDLPILFGAL